MLLAVTKKGLGGLRVCQPVPVGDHHEEGGDEVLVPSSQFIDLGIEDLTVTSQVSSVLAQRIITPDLQPVRVGGDLGEIDALGTFEVWIDIAEYLEQQVVDGIGDGAIRLYQGTHEDGPRKYFQMLKIYFRTL